jgi:hypothetical protein
MKHVFFGLCVLGLVVIVICVVWWSAHKGKVIEDVRLIESGQAHSGPVDGTRPTAGDRDGPLGPYALTPDDNPILLTATVSDPPPPQTGPPPRTRVYITMVDESGKAVWTGSELLGIADYGRPGSASRQEVTLPAQAEAGVLEPITITKPGDYAFRCGIETLPDQPAPDWFDVQLVIRKNAHPFPAVWAAGGFGLIVLGALLLQMSAGEEADKTPATPDDSAGDTPDEPAGDTPETA